VLCFDAFLADNTIFYNIKAIINYYLKHKYHIVVTLKSTECQIQLTIQYSPTAQVVLPIDDACSKLHTFSLLSPEH
jgi:hypothetical protein